MVENKWIKNAQDLVAMETSNRCSSWLDIEEVTGVVSFFDFLFSSAKK